MIVKNETVMDIVHVVVTGQVNVETAVVHGAGIVDETHARAIHSTIVITGLVVPVSDVEAVQVKYVEDVSMLWRVDADTLLILRLR